MLTLLDKNRAGVLLDANIDDRFEMLVDDLIERESVGMIVAPSKAKKSMMALNLAMALIAKKPFIGKAVSERPEKILYVNLELTSKALAFRLRSMNKYYETTPNRLNNLYFVSAEDWTNGHPLVDCNRHTVDPKPFGELEKLARDFGATVLIVDPLYYVVGEENDNVLMTAVLKEFAKLRDSLNCTVVIVHHCGKGKTDWEEPFQAGRGASSIGGFFEWVLGIEPMGTHSVLHHGSRNLKGEEPLDIRFDTNNFVWEPTSNATPDQVLDKIFQGPEGAAQSLGWQQYIEEMKKLGFNVKQATAIIDRAKTYKRLKGHRGQLAQVVRNFD